jgi:hypothetical protein
MAKAMTIDWRAVWWTTIFVTIPVTVVNRLFVLIQKSLNADAYTSMQGYFALYQPDYFPLIFLVAMFIAVFVLTLVYTIILPQLPSNWIVRGVLIGGFFFLAADLPYAVHTGYTTVMPGAVARSAALAALISDLVNGCVLANIHMRVARVQKKKK